MQLQFVFNGVSRKFRMIESVGFGRQFRLFTASPQSLHSFGAFRCYPGRRASMMARNYYTIELLDCLPGRRPYILLKVRSSLRKTTNKRTASDAKGNDGSFF
jgi:hypothetical protein